MVSMTAYGIPPPHYRLPDDTRVGGVTLQVSDLARSMAYYVDLLGFRVLSQHDGYAALGAHGDAVPLVELREKRGVRPVQRRGLLGLYHFAILVPDRAALGRFVSHIGRLGVRAGSADHLVSEALYLYDPDGLGIEVYRDRPRADWSIDAGQLVMTVDPLDLDDLAVAGGGVAWTGMPAGTVIGHVHLFVGSLAEAESFYHHGLGFDKTSWNLPGALFLSAGGYHHHLGTNTWAVPAPVASDDDARLLYWSLQVPTAEDVARAVASLSRVAPQVDTGPRGPLVPDRWGTRVHITHATG